MKGAIVEPGGYYDDSAATIPLRAVEHHTDGMRAARKRITVLEGRAEAEDGRIKVTWAAGRGLDDLRIDPRAMRLGSDELADAIKGAITSAMTDLQRQVNEVMGEELTPRSTEPPP
jgi:DNA-binding protein YbaB